MYKQFKIIKSAYTNLAQISDSERNTILNKVADTLEESQQLILVANQKDLCQMAVTDAKYDRLQLTQSRIIDMAHQLRQVALMPSVLDKILLKRELANGLLLHKVSVPLGLIGIIYESRPNVTVDVFSLCFKSGNACILKGGKEAYYSNQILVDLIHKVLKQYNINPHIIYLMPADRKYMYELLNAVGIIDVCIPRGSKSLIDFVRQNAKIPVIETGAGVVHTYFDETAQLSDGIKIIHNAKTRRVGVCNALDTLLIHDKRLVDLPQLVAPLIPHNVQLFADAKSYTKLKQFYPAHLLFKATKEHFGYEFLDYKMAIKSVKSIEQAILHIKTHSSGHSEAIITQSTANIDKFMQSIDAAAIYANASTAFTDGAQFGMGSEIGISTQKLHVRGPIGINDLISYKWLVYGTGQIRDNN